MTEEGGDIGPVRPIALGTEESLMVIGGAVDLGPVVCEQYDDALSYRSGSRD